MLRNLIFRNRGYIGDRQILDKMTDFLDRVYDNTLLLIEQYISQL